MSEEVKEVKLEDESAEKVSGGQGGARWSFTCYHCGAHGERYYEPYSCPNCGSGNIKSSLNC